MFYLNLQATWHALAKLQIHTNKTLNLLEAAMATLTNTMRHFLRETCEAITTWELKKEVAACGQCKAALAVKGDSCAAKGKATTVARLKKLNLATYKYHSLANYAETIQRFRPTDNYNTQIVGMSSIYSALPLILLHSRASCSTDKSRSSMQGWTRTMLHPRS